MFTTRLHSVPLAAATLAALLLLSACGGGGGGAATDTASSSSASSAASAAAPLQLSGVAAFGAPLSGATLRVIDAKGKAVGSATTNQADGSYTLTLPAAAAATPPLLLQAAGFDATGQPLLLHSAFAVPAAASAAASGAASAAVSSSVSAAASAAASANVVVNITPLTDAVVALTLGTEPRKVFAQPANYSAQLAALAQLGPASDFVKTLVKTNLSDAKAGTLTSLDLFADANFAATKAGVDLALETLSFGIGSSALHRDQLQLANKLGSKLVEVTVDLATANSELAKTTGAVPANAITSTLKATTSPTTLVTRLAALDALVVSMNSAIAAGGSGAAVTALTSAYTRHNGRDASALTALIAGWAQQGTQLGRMQVTGCIDGLTTTGTTTTTTTTTSSNAALACTRVAVASRLNDTAGKEAGSFADVVVYNATTAKWSLVGNGLPAEVTARAIAWLGLNADGAKLAGQAINPRVGVQLGVQGLPGSSTSVTAAAVQTPSNYVLTFVPCGQPALCISPTAGGTSTVASGTPNDQSVFQGTSAWMGGADVAVGANYSFTLKPASSSSSSASTNTVTLATLRSGFADTPADARFPVLDGVKPALPLSGATLFSGTTLAWQTWAAANPDMRLLTVRLVLAAATAGDAPLVVDAQPARWQAGSLEWPAVNPPAGFSPAGITLWLIAIDAAGRQYVTGYVLVAP